MESTPVSGLFDIYLPVAGIHFNVLVLLAIGFSVGTLGGFLGSAAAGWSRRALNIFGFPMPYAIGTDLAHIFANSIVSTTKHRKMGNVDVKMGLVSIVGSMMGVEVGARTIDWLTKRGLAGGVVRYAYMVLLFGLGVFMLYDYFTKDQRSARKAALEQGPAAGQAPRKRSRGLPPMIHFPVSGVTASLWTILGVFFVTGWLSGFLGVGGGFIAMPTLIYIIGCPTVVAVGTCLFSLMFTGCYGCFRYALMGRVEIIAALIMLIGASIGAQVGVTAVKYVQGYGIRLLFAIMILLAGLSVTLKQMASFLPECATAARYVVLGSALGMCVVIMIRLGQGFLKKKAGKQSLPAS